ncbi:hypothetical protein F511_40946 [Dorcoceras hygrometricum]|uniref:Uncharacterized protein n=1 Tax=Dorcoceras hygrometricum TaxID=472368 RepID=A0A2Z7BXV2_9LAMI|nr:hypothetical protein F511_40946 [Dorcoceras hygrometricum]
MGLRNISHSELQDKNEEQVEEEEQELFWGWRDSSDPRYNPLLQPVAPRTPSNHCTSARKLRVSDSLLYYLSEKGYRHFINVSVRKTT